MKRSHHDGFSLIQVLVALGVLSTVTLMFTALFVRSTDQQMQVTTKYNIEQIRRNLTTMLSNGAVWSQVLSKNASLKCLLTPGTPKCPHNQKIDFIIYTAGGAPYFDAATQGFKLDGEICPLSEANCAVRMTMQAEIKCPTGLDPCDTPDSVVALGTFTQVKLPDGTVFPFNPGNYLVRVREDGAVAASGGDSLQIKCGFITNLSGAPITSECSGYNMYTATMQSPMCTPGTCPSGYSDGGITSELTGVAVTAGGNLIVGNCVRTCYQ